MVDAQARAIAVERPGAWCIVPLAQTDLVANPADQDHPPRWSTDSGLDWMLIARTVTAAVRAVQSDLADPMTTMIQVPVTLLPDAELYVVEEWLSGGVSPEFAPAFEQVINGRHRTWFSYQAGAVEAPVINSSAGDAISGWNDTAGIYLPIDGASLDAWTRERRWWDRPESEAWKRLNGRHLELWDLSLGRWDERLDLSSQ